PRPRRGADVLDPAPLPGQADDRGGAVRPLHRGQLPRGGDREPGLGARALRRGERAVIIELASLYLIVGAGCAVAALRSPPRRLAAAALLVALWPLLAPLLLAARTTPAPGLAIDVNDRVAAAHARLAALDGALARPELDLDRARARLVDLERAG